MTENINTKHKDRLFNYIFGREENREWTLQLYNAVNGSHYEDASAIEFNTLKDVLYIGMKNDTSFLLSDIMSVYEHQSSFNPNIPLRMLGYVGDLYSKYISKNRLNKYGSSLIMLPTPKLVVFYNGSRDTEDEVIFKLSDSFDKTSRDGADIEVRVRMLNINFGRSPQLMKACKPLEEYSWFINRINEELSYQETKDMPAAVKTAIQKMPQDFGIRPFLVSHKAEVEGMLDTEYNEAEVKELFVEEGRREGIKEGIKEGIAQGVKEGIAQGIREGHKQGMKEGIAGSVALLRSLDIDDATIVSKLVEQYALTEAEAKSYVHG